MERSGSSIRSLWASWHRSAGSPDPKITHRLVACIHLETVPVTLARGFLAGPGRFLHLLLAED